ncbi:MAG: IPTL-CTERM sorting domain-containing protein [Acidobacteriota bacterium]
MWSPISTFRVSTLALFLALAFSFIPQTGSAGGTPDPGTSPLVEDSGDADTLPDNENQLLATLGPDRGFNFGDYLLSNQGLQSLGAVSHDFYIEVPPSLSAGMLVVEVFDADLGAGDVAGTEEHDQDNTTSGWDAATTFELFAPDGTSVASISLPGQDCDPVTVGLQTFCNNAWSDLGVFSVSNPAPGHWRMAVSSPNSGPTDEDDANAFGIRAHDGSAGAGANEINVYADSYVGIGQVYAASFASDPGYSRTHDFYPYVQGYCSLSCNDFDVDVDGDESLTWTTRAGASPTFTPTFSGNGVWAENAVTDFASASDASDYGLWSARWIIGLFNHVTWWVGDPTSDNPADGATTPASGGPDMQPEAGAVRLYLPADGSRFFGERGGADDVVIAPVKPWVGHSWALLAGEPPLAVGVTSRVRVTVTVTNPTEYPIQLDAATGGTNVAVATVPTNGGQTTYVAGSAAIAGGTSSATAEAGAGPWTLTFAPGVVAAGTSASLTYDIDVLPTATGTLDLTGGPPPDAPAPGTGTTATFLDETCADAGGSTSACASAALSRATTRFGPLCRLTAEVTTVGAPGLTVTKTAGAVVDSAGNPGQFEVPYTVTLENTGATDLVMVQVADDLTATFPPPATFAVITGPTASGSLSANGAFDGDGDSSLLVAAGSTLPIGDSETIGFTVRFDPNGLAGPFNNTANGSAQDPIGNPVTDDDAVEISVSETPAITIVKTAGAITDIGGGQFEATFSLVVTNPGNVDLSMVQVTDDLVTTFPAPVNLVSAMAACSAGSCGTVTLDFTGPTDTTLLDASASSLAPAATVTLDLTVVLEPNGELGPFTNSATADASSPAGTPVTDTDTADVSIVENPAISVTKTVDGPVVDNLDGTFTVPYLLTVSNTGNVVLTEVQVTDDLTATFPPPSSVSSVTVPVASGTLTANGGFDGDGDTSLLDAAASTLPLAAVETISFSVTFTSAGIGGPFTNTVEGEGSSPAGTMVTASDSVDISVTPPDPSIGIAKSAGLTVDNGDGTYTVPILILVENLGPLDLFDVQVTDDLNATFPAPASVIAVTSPTATLTGGTGTLMANAGYDGLGDTTLLVSASSTLDIGAMGEIAFEVTIDPAGIMAFDNQAVATGESLNGSTTDLSHDGPEPDPDGDDNANEDGENDPTPILVEVPTILEIPTLGQWGLIAMMTLLVAAAWRRLQP